MLPRAFKHEQTLNFSYSGLKTAVINYIQNAKARGEEICPADVACSFQTAATDVMVENALAAAKQNNLKTIVIAGGVGANAALRQALEAEAKKEGITVLYPPLKLCTDNAAMIGAEAYFMYKAGKPPADLTLDAKANVNL